MDDYDNESTASARRTHLQRRPRIAAGIRACVLAFSLGTGVFAAGHAHAADGSIIVTGNIVSPTCSASGDGAGGEDFTVSLPNITTAQLPTPGSTSVSAPYVIRINGSATTCPDGTRVAIFYDPASPQIDAATGNLRLASGSTAAGVQIQVLNEANTVLDLRRSTQSAIATVIGGSASIGFATRYVAMTAVRAGSATTSVLYTLAYP